MPIFEGKAEILHDGSRVVVNSEGVLTLNEGEDDGWAFEFSVEGTTTYIRAVKGEETQFVWSDDSCPNWFEDAESRKLSITTKTW